MNQNIYFDTSALAKWYLNESRSNEVEEYIRAQGPVFISDLTIVEMRCLLARRRREKSIDAKLETEVFAAFQEDIRKRFVICHPLPEGLSWGTVNLISAVPDIPLRTLDALHLWVAKEIQADVLATADRIMAQGGQALGFSVIRFD